MRYSNNSTKNVCYHYTQYIRKLECDNLWIFYIVVFKLKFKNHNSSQWIRQQECLYTNNWCHTRDCKWETVIFQSTTSSKCWQLTQVNKHNLGLWPHLGLGSFDCQLVLSPTSEGSGTAVNADMSGSDPLAMAKTTGSNTESASETPSVYSYVSSIFHITSLKMS